MKRWFGDPLFLRALALALAAGLLDGAAGWLGGLPHPWHDGSGVACGVMVGAAAMRLWTWKEKP